MFLALVFLSIYTKNGPSQRGKSRERAKKTIVVCAELMV